MRQCGKILKRTRRDPNEIILHKDYAEIVLYNKNNKETARTKIDLDDVEKCSKYKWHINYYGYAGTLNLRLHQFLLGKKNDLHIDHINHDTLDNRKKNLRHCTRSQNQMNRKGKGYYWIKMVKKWRVAIGKNKKFIHGGYFTTEREAQEKVKELKKEYFGEFRYIQGR